MNKGQMGQSILEMLLELIKVIVWWVFIKVVIIWHRGNDRGGDIGLIFNDRGNDASVKVSTWDNIITDIFSIVVVYKCDLSKSSMFTPFGSYLYNSRKK